MDKDTAVAIEQLKAREAETRKIVDDIQRERERWRAFLWKIMTRSILWLVAILITTASFGYHLPDNIRKSVANIILNWGGE